jgi:hypothetical protein
MKVTLKNRNGTKRVIDNANCLIVRVPSLAPGLADEIVVDSSEVASIHLDGPVVAPPPDQLEVEDREFDMSVYSRDGQRVGPKKLVTFRVRADTPKIATK